MSKLETDSGINVLDLIDAIKATTQPISGHTDPNSIDDCFDELKDWVSKVNTQPAAHRDPDFMNILCAALQGFAMNVKIGDSRKKIAEESILLAETTIQELNNHEQRTQGKN